MKSWRNILRCQIRQWAPYAKEKCVHVRVAMKGLRENSEDIEKEIDKIVEEIRKIYPDAIEL